MEKEYLDTLFEEYKRAKGINDNLSFDMEKLEEFIESRKISSSLLATLLLFNMKVYPMVMEYNLGGLNTNAMNIIKRNDYVVYSATTKYPNSYDKYKNILKACFNGSITYDTYPKVSTVEGKKIMLNDYADTIVTDPTFLAQNEINNLVNISKLNTDVFFGINGIKTDKDVNEKLKKLSSIKKLILDSCLKNDVLVTEKSRTYDKYYACIVRARKIKK